MDIYHLPKGVWRIWMKESVESATLGMCVPVGESKQGNINKSVCN